jgi:transposase
VPVDWEQVAAERGVEIERLQVENTELKARLAKLEERMGQNPRNSSMPPSAEGLAKPPSMNRKARRATQRRPGKQPGQEGSYLVPVEHPDEVVVHAPASCTRCGADLAQGEVEGSESRQVFDLPAVRPYVTEHQMETRRCRCGCVTKAEAPREATAPACYGPSIRALTCYLAVYQHLPYDRMRRLFADVFGIGIAEGTLVAIVKEAGGALGLFTQVVADLLAAAPAVHFDETGARTEGSLHWVHVASTSLYTLLVCDKRRGKAGMEALSVIGRMEGVAVHDGWASYKSYAVLHALCNAHHARELQGVVDNLSQDWANELIDLLVDMKEAVETAKAAGRTALAPGDLHGLRVRYGTLIARGQRENPCGGCTSYAGAKKKAHNLVLRLDAHRNEVLRFLTDFDVPWDNNQAERDIRMVKLQQKISGSWRTLAGAQGFCAIRSYISTMNKHGADVIEGLRGVFTGTLWLPPTPSPA